MAKKKISQPKIKAEATAKAELVAKAIYQRKRTTTEIIPPDVSRAKAATWLTIVSPLTEWAGLRGDILRSKRDQLRLQREDILLAIARKAKDRIYLEGGANTVIPNKFTVPFLEKASLEDPESPLCDIWSNLFVEAARNFDPKLQVYADILSRISWKEAKFLRDVCLRSNFRDGTSWPHGHFRDNEHAVSSKVEILDCSKHEDIDSKKRWRQFKNETEARIQFCYLIHGTVLLSKGSHYFYNEDFLDGIENPSVVFDMLEREGLVKRVQVSFGMTRSSGNGSVSYVDLTYLGIDLIRICTRDFSLPVA